MVKINLDLKINLVKLEDENKYQTDISHKQTKTPWKDVQTT